MSCCKKKTEEKKAKTSSSETAEAGGAQSVAKSAAKQKTSSEQPVSIGGYRLGELALAAGALVLLPIVLNRVAPKALESVKDFFDIASKSSRA